MEPEQINEEGSVAAIQGQQGPSKRGRIVVRNLIFDINEKLLRKQFSQFGEIREVDIPVNELTQKKKGFAFIQYATGEQAVDACKAMNQKKYKGRNISVEMAKSKDRYIQFLDEIQGAQTVSKKKKEENEGEDVDLDDLDESKDDEVKPKSQKKKHSKENMDVDLNGSEANGSTNAGDDEDMEEETEEKLKKKKKNNFDSEKTVFVRNVDFEIDEVELQRFARKWGKIKYAKLVVSKDTGMSKGTGFILFKDKASADKMIEVSRTLEGKIDQLAKSGRDKRQRTNVDSAIDYSHIPEYEEMNINGRRILALPAVTRKDARDGKLPSKDNMNKDRRNLALLREGLVFEPEITKTLAESDIKKREEALKKKEAGIKANPNLFVSRTRIALRNLVKEIEEEELKDKFSIFAEEVGITVRKKKLFKQIKLLREKEKDSEELGKSKGIGFIEFDDPEDALKIVRHANKNLSALGPKLPIIEFALEDHRVMKKREQKLEKQKKKQAEAIKLAKSEEKEETKDTVKDPELEKLIQSDNLEELQKIDLSKLNSRGKRQRIQKKIKKLKKEQGVVEQVASTQVAKKKKNTEKASEQASKEKSMKPKKREVDPQVVKDIALEKEIQRKNKASKKARVRRLENDDTEQKIRDYQAKKAKNEEPKKLENIMAEFQEFYKTNPDFQ